MYCQNIQLDSFFFYFKSSPHFMNFTHQEKSGVVSRFDKIRFPKEHLHIEQVWFECKDNGDRRHLLTLKSRENFMQVLRQ